MARAGLIADYEPTSRDSGIVVPATPDRSNRITAEDVAKIRELALDGAYINETDLFGFDAIASTDALDSYFTRPHPERALAPYVEDLKSGTAVLGNHDYATWAVGRSFDGEVVDVAGRDSWVKGFEAKRGARGRYYTIRDLEMSGQKTNDIIRSMQYGIASRVSVTFLPQRYECSLDGKDMLAYECEHFPGVRYGDTDELCYAWIMDSRLLETSLVFRNASPDAMLQRKIAEGIAQGEIPAGAIPYLAQRFALPTPTAKRFTIHRKEGALDDKEREGQPPADPPKADADEKKPDEKGEEEKADEKKADDATPDEKADEKADDEKDKADEDKDRQPKPAAELTAAERAQAFEAILGTAGDGEIDGLAERLETHLASKGAKPPAARAAAEREARIRAALGIKETDDIEASASDAARRAQMGDALFADLVDRTVKARVSAGAEFNEEAYRKHLTKSQDVEFVRSELASHEAARRDRWKAGRVIEPLDDGERVSPEPERPARSDANVLEGLTPRGDKGRSKQPYAVPAKKS